MVALRSIIIRIDPIRPPGECRQAQIIIKNKIYGILSLERTNGLTGVNFVLEAHHYLPSDPPNVHREKETVVLCYNHHRHHRSLSHTTPSGEWSELKSFRRFLSRWIYLGGIHLAGSVIIFALSFAIVNRKWNVFFRNSIHLGRDCVT